MLFSRLCYLVNLGVIYGLTTSVYVRGGNRGFNQRMPPVGMRLEVSLAVLTFISVTRWRQRVILPSPPFPSPFGHIPRMLGVRVSGPSPLLSQEKLFIVNITYD